MSDYRTEEEQIEALKNWWDENGTSLIITVAVALLIVFGFRTWQEEVKETGEAASSLYQDLIETVLVVPGQQLDESSVQTGRYLADSLKSGHEDSIYASFAALAMAKQAAEAGDLDAAAEELNWVIDRDVDDSVTLVARLRLARVLSAQGKHDEALAVLTIERPGGHLSSVEEARGDIYMRLGREADAREAYERALAALPERGSKPMLQMKLDDLSTAPEASDVKEASGEAAGGGEEELEPAAGEGSTGR